MRGEHNPIHPLRSNFMIRAQQALRQILLIGIDEEPQEVLVLKARTIVERFKATISAAHPAVTATDDKCLHVAAELAKLRNAVDLEIDRRVDEDLADGVCDLLEQLSVYLHGEIGDQPELTTRADAKVASQTPLSPPIRSSGQTPA
jgi:hypothetical protein